MPSNYKKTLRHKKNKTNRKTNKTHRRTNRKTRRRTNRKMKGGDYAKDITTRTIEGFPSKPLNNITVTGPGFVLSGSAYVQLMEDRDRNGTDY